MGKIVKRAQERITRGDLERLGEIARADREAMFAKNPRWARYRDRLLCVTLCQGAALHYLDGKNGVKDFDVWTFFAALPSRYPDPALYRRNKPHDFGPSKFGRHPDFPEYAGRKVDLLSDSIPASVSSDPAVVIPRWLRSERRGNPFHLATKAVVQIAPMPGVILWRPE